ncbi:MAG: ABC transporter substrate-binding protein [Atopobiaceae bacterium]|jgi:polar amino acid transport system substrate-binding protein|nr:ABC transporter substrate-binding protein [Atopobiaceae bacterium]
MKKRSSILAICACLLAALACVVLVGCGGQPAADKTDDASTTETTDTTEAAESATTDAGDYTLVEDGKLIVASDLDFPPLDSFEGGEAKGFDVELSQAIAEKMGLECEYLPPMNFDAIIPLIQQGGKADIGNSAFSITDERKKEIDFTDAYLDSNLGIAVKKDSGIAGDEAAIIEALSADGVVVAVQAGTTGQDWAEENLPKDNVRPFDSVTNCITGVSTGKFDAFVADLPVIGYQCTQFTDCEVCLEIPTGEQYGIVVSKDNPGLTAAINDALAEMEKDGTMADLKEKWFGITE